jgi:glycerol-1-phosphate dehydrogenase [NAD(P)+]
MIQQTQITIPSLVRIKPGALDRIGIYLKRFGHTKVAILFSEGIVPDLLKRVEESFAGNNIESVQARPIAGSSFERASELFTELWGRCDAFVGLGGGQALDTAKYVAFLSDRPYYAIPTSLSNDGFASPWVSLTLSGHRRSLRSAMPFAVVVDTDVCINAPDLLWWSGVGDLLAKLTAIFDWKLAFHIVGTPVNDFAALLSDATVHQFMADPNRCPVEGPVSNSLQEVMGSGMLLVVQIGNDACHHQGPVGKPPTLRSSLLHSEGFLDVEMMLDKS